MGFTNPESVNVGGSMRLYVSTTSSAYTFAIYRIGWYGGKGGRLLYSSPSIVGSAQPAPTIDPKTRMVSCANWRHPLTIRIPSAWVSGVYVAKLRSSDGSIRFAPFVVRNDASHAQILDMIPFMTYQAYNLFGGSSLYDGPDATGKSTHDGRSYVVSFDRPYLAHAGLMDLAAWGDNDTTRWLEREGYDVAYTSDVQLQAGGSLLLHHRLVIVSGHSEYWSTPMRAAITTARDAGVSLAFFGGNDVYWHVRLQPGALGANREVVCYRYANLDPRSSGDPSETTVRWVDPPLNDSQGPLLGGAYTGVYLGSLPIIFSEGAAPLLVNTGLVVGSQVPGLVGDEGDAIYHPPTGTTLPYTITALSAVYVPGQRTAANQCTGCGHTMNMTLYTAPSGARVFDAGSMEFAWGLDNEQWDTHERKRNFSSGPFQLFVRNLLAEMLRAPGAPTS